MRKGYKIPFKRKMPPMSEQHKLAISLANKGHKTTSETKAKISSANKGRKFGVMPKEYREKISKSLKGKMPKFIPNNKGIKRTYEQRNIGEKHWNWKGGITPEMLKIRNSMELRLWRKAVYERDDFTCQKTKIKGGRLVAHHINNFADFPELRTSIENGITLGREVHKEFHKKYGIKNNTMEQLLEFLNYKKI